MTLPLSFSLFQNDVSLGQMDDILSQTDDILGQTDVILVADATVAQVLSLQATDLYRRHILTLSIYFCSRVG